VGAGAGVRESGAAGGAVEDLETGVRGAELDLRVLLRLRVAAARAEAALAQALRAELGETTVRCDALDHLYRAGDGLTLTRLARRLMVSNSAVTGLVERLRADGLVARAAVRGDRRAARVRLTEAGRAAFAEMDRVRRAALSATLGALDPQTLARLYADLGAAKAAAGPEPESGTE
jgi:DNA-binding MarR family transcriptional regulator